MVALLSIAWMAESLEIRENIRSAKRNWKDVVNAAALHRHRDSTYAAKEVVAFKNLTAEARRNRPSHTSVIRAMSH